MGKAREEMLDQAFSTTGQNQGEATSDCERVASLNPGCQRVVDYLVDPSGWVKGKTDKDVIYYYNVRSQGEQRLGLVRAHAAIPQ